jgi:hypothetical protein
MGEKDTKKTKKTSPKKTKAPATPPENQGKVVNKITRVDH